MLYRLLKIPARFAFLIYCRNLRISNPAIRKMKGPLLIAANHPNSFLDAIILATLFDKPVYSLVRGDVYTNKFFAAILTSLNMLPVYRISEGVENLEQNYDTFEKCKAIFKQNGIVLIFSEGRCINEWHLRPLKKGTARLAISSWEEGIDLKVLPTGINYQSFTSFGKNIQLNTGNVINRTDLEETNGYGSTINHFNKILKHELSGLVVHAGKTEHEKIRHQFAIKTPMVKRILLALPAIAGYILHAPLYFPIQRFTWKKASHIDHYDSVLVGLLFILYPFYLLLAALVIHAFICGYWWLLVFVVLPFCAWSFVQLKKQF